METGHLYSVIFLIYSTENRFFFIDFLKSWSGFQLNAVTSIKHQHTERRSGHQSSAGQRPRDVPMSLGSASTNPANWFASLVNLTGNEASGLERRMFRPDKESICDSFRTNVWDVQDTNHSGNNAVWKICITGISGLQVARACFQMRQLADHINCPTHQVEILSTWAQDDAFGHRRLLVWCCWAAIITIPNYFWSQCIGLSIWETVKSEAPGEELPEFIPNLFFQVTYYLCLGVRSCSLDLTEGSFWNHGQTEAFWVLQGVPN